MFTPGASPARQSLEKASIKPLVLLHQLPRWLPPIAVAALFVAGIAVHGPVGAVALCLVAVFVGWLAALSWPAQAASSRALRIAIVVLIIGLAGWQLTR